MDKFIKKFKVCNKENFKISDHDPAFSDIYKKDQSVGILPKLIDEMER